MKTDWLSMDVGEAFSSIGSMVRDIAHIGSMVRDIVHYAELGSFALLLQRYRAVACLPVPVLIGGVAVAAAIYLIRREDGDPSAAAGASR